MGVRLLVGAVGFSLIATSPLTAQERANGFYIGGVAGAQFFSDNETEGADVDFDTGYVVGGLAGFRFGSTRAEAELDYQETEANDVVDVEILRYTAGLYYDFIGLEIPLTPYVGGGLGLASVDTSEDIDETNFTLHGEIGGSFALGPQLEIVPAYRYEWIDDDGLDLDDPLTSHAIRLGARLSF